MNKKYPVGSEFIFPAGSENPASYIGGDWKLIASNKKISMGISVSSSINQNGNFIFINSYSNVIPVCSNAGKNPSLYVDTAGNSIGGANMKYWSGISATTSLSEENSIYVDIWKRLG